uniref:EGF-like domain-containing protein n=1 Tax=Amphimedon queenslandica TaxID=400682 RepID=A0A1X7TDT6_AMPQE
MMREAVLVFVLCVLSLSVAQDCPLPTIAQLEAALPPLLVISDSGQSYSPNVTEGSVQYVCLAQGSMIGTYQAIALIATFTPNPGEPEQTSIFDIECSSGTWSGRTGSLDPPPASVVGVPPRTDCYRCREGFGGDTRCRECDSACNSGLMRCTGSGSGDCCLSFTANGQCDGSTDCTSSGPNYVATESNNFTCTCNLTCSAGYTANSNCTGCDSTSICDADNPCMNGGECIQNSPPDNYTCNCTGTGYEGVNCTVMFTSTPSPTPSSTHFSSSSPSPSFSPICTVSNCDNCQNSFCCKTCSFGSYLNPDGCTCGPCRVSNCLRCELLNSSCCTECGSGYELVNGCQCGAITYPCTQPVVCEKCDATGCCQTCSSGYSMSANNCLCRKGYTPSANCTSCVLTNICEASNPCGTADCSLGSQPHQYTCYCAANRSTQTKFIKNLKPVLVENGTNKVEFFCSASVQSNANINFEVSDLFDNEFISSADCDVTTTDNPTIRMCDKRSNILDMNVMIMCSYSTSYKIHCTFSWNLINSNARKVYPVACHFNDGTTEASTRTELIVKGCNNPCNSGCTGGDDCCLSFTANSQCITRTDCTSSGPNYVATESYSFTCTCNSICSDGYTLNSNCTGCDFTSICDRDSPCMNGGQCIQHSPHYTCDCTRTGYQRVNCTADVTHFFNPTRNGNEVTLPPCSFPDGIYYLNGPNPDSPVAPVNQNYTLTLNGSTEGRYACGSSAFGGGITLLRQFKENNTLVPKTFTWGQRQVLDCTGYAPGNYHSGYKVAWLLDGHQRCFKGSACEDNNFNINPDNFSLSFDYYPTFTTYECQIESDEDMSLTTVTVASYTLSPSHNDQTQTKFIKNLKPVLVENGMNKVEFSCSASVQSNANINFEVSDLFDNEFISSADCDVTTVNPTIRMCDKPLYGMIVMIMCDYSTNYEIHCTFSWDLTNSNESRVYSVACHVNDGTTEASTRTELIVRRQFLQNDTIVPKTFVWGQCEVLDCTGYVAGNYHEGYKAAWLLDGLQKYIRSNGSFDNNFNINLDNFSLSFDYYPTFTTYECQIESDEDMSLTTVTVASYTLSPSNNNS